MSIYSAKQAGKQRSSDRHNSPQGKANSRVFTSVSYRLFRQHLADIHSSTVKARGFETTIFDRRGDIQAIVHAAAIDANGHCHPAEYYIRSSALILDWPLAA